MKIFDVAVRQLKQLFIRNFDNLIGLDIGTGFVKVAEIKRKGGQSVLTNLGRVALSNEVMNDGYIIDKDGMTKAIRECMAVSCADGKKVVVGLSGRHVFSREIIMPVMPQQELAEAVKWGLEEYVPYPVDSFYYDFDVIGANEDGKTLSLLLVAAPYEVVNPLIEAVTTAGLELVAIETEALASIRALQQENSGAGASRGCYFVMDIGAKLSQLTIFQKGVPLFTRMVPIGGIHFTQVIAQTTGLDFAKADTLKSKEANLLQDVDFIGASKINQELKQLIGQLAHEVRRTLDFFITQNNQVTINQIFLVGGGACLKNLLPELRRQVDLTIEFVNPLACMSASDAFDPEFLERVIPQMAVAVGLALRGDAR